MNILQDIKTAAGVFGAFRKSRKIGASAVKIQPVYTVPVVTFAPAYYNTIEGCLTHKLGRDIDRTVMEVFKSLPYEVQRRMERDEHRPEDGGWVDRANVWRQALKPVLPPREYHTVMALFIGWYAHCLRMERGGEQHG